MNVQIERIRSKAATAAVAADVAHFRRSASSSGVAVSTSRDASVTPLRHAFDSSAASHSPSTMLRIEHGDVFLGEGIESVSRGRDGSTTLRSHAGAEVCCAAAMSRAGVHCAMCPPPAILGFLLGAAAARLLLASNARFFFEEDPIPCYSAGALVRRGLRSRGGKAGSLVSRRLVVASIGARGQRRYKLPLVLAGAYYAGTEYGVAPLRAHHYAGTEYFVVPLPAHHRRLMSVQHVFMRLLWFVVLLHGTR